MCFTRLTRRQIEDQISTNVSDPATHHLWTLFGLVLSGVGVARGEQECPITTSVCKQIPGLVNAGFSCLGPDSQTGWHTDIDRGFDRLHLSLAIPPGDCVFRVRDQERRWDRDEIIIFDDTMRHNALNPTNSPRYVLLVDLLRSPGRKAVMKQVREALKKAARMGTGGIEAQALSKEAQEKKQMEKLDRLRRAEQAMTGATTGKSFEQAEQSEKPSGDLTFGQA
eukprot:TRINITY_DN5337_c0_g1_i5.p1 TRINITY_DN5337_c0_g1~~TRINITY_DN5337_c0_g1_i5.p1  ORF type:complete len:224 (-),score=60.42 TRINITY_DN5337_c0_g1_i5:111-782(-)